MDLADRHQPRQDPLRQLSHLPFRAAVTHHDEELSPVERDRREKLERLVAEGVEPYRRNFSRTHTAAQALSLLGPEQDSEAGPVSVAGRLMVKRVTGGMAFTRLQDVSGDIQLVAQRNVLGERIRRFRNLVRPRVGGIGICR